MGVNDLRGFTTVQLADGSFVSIREIIKKGAPSFTNIQHHTKDRIGYIDASALIHKALRDLCRKPLKAVAVMRALHEARDDPSDAGHILAALPIGGVTDEIEQRIFNNLCQLH